MYSKILEKVLIPLLGVVFILISSWYSRYLNKRIDELTNMNNQLSMITFDINKTIDSMQIEYKRTSEHIYNLQVYKDNQFMEFLKIKKEVNLYEDSEVLSPTLYSATSYVLSRLRTETTSNN